MIFKYRKEEGALLLMSIVVLAILTLLGMMAAKGITNANRVAAYNVEKTTIDQTAEFGLTAAESVIFDLPSLTLKDLRTISDGKSGNIWVRTFTEAGALDLTVDTAWWAQGNHMFAGDLKASVAKDYEFIKTDSINKAASTNAPRYVIERLVDISETPELLGSNDEHQRQFNYFRVTARAEGGDSQSESMTQSIFRTWDMPIEY